MSPTRCCLTGCNSLQIKSKCTNLSSKLYLPSRSSVHNSRASLMVWENQSVCYNDIFASTSGKYDYFCDVLGCQWLTAAVCRLVDARNRYILVYREHLRINGVSLSFVPIKPHNREFSLHLARVNPNYPNPLRNQFFAQAFSE